MKTTNTMAGCPISRVLCEKWVFSPAVCWLGEPALRFLATLFCLSWWAAFFATTPQRPHPMLARGLLLEVKGPTSRKEREKWGTQI